MSHWEGDEKHAKKPAALFSMQISNNNEGMVTNYTFFNHPIRSTQNQRGPASAGNGARSKKHKLSFFRHRHSAHNTNNTTTTSTRHSSIHHSHCGTAQLQKKRNGNAKGTELGDRDAESVIINQHLSTLAVRTEHTQISRRHAQHLSFRHLASSIWWQCRFRASTKRIIAT